MTTTTAGTPVASEKPGLRAVDRCDRCGAQAVVATRHDSGVLMWCGHHFRDHGPALKPFVYHDERPMSAR